MRGMPSKRGLIGNSPPSEGWDYSEFRWNRIISFALGIVTYAQFPERLEESLYFSTLTFMVGPVDYEPLGLGQWIAMVNTAIGPILIALLVFVFGRRAAR